MIPIFDVLLFLITCFLAYTNAGTIMGAILTLACFFQCYTIVRFIKMPTE